MAEAPSKKTLLYIGGYGRSGSTLLGRILTLNPRVVDLGEVTTVTRYRAREHYRCSCRKPLTDCPVWGPALRSVDPPPTRFAGRKVHLALLEVIGGEGKAEFLVDSSKSAGSHAALPFYLARHLSYPVRLVHLVRDPRAVLWSFVRTRIKRNIVPRWPLSRLSLAVKVAASWSFANLSAECFGLLAPDRYTRVIYDRILSDGLPGDLQTLVSAAPLEGMSLSVAPENAHAIGGNPMRKRRKVEIAADEEWRKALSAPLAVTVTLICFPLMLRYRLM